MSSPPRTSVTAIVAATLSNGIGKDGGLPWRLPGEMKYFQRVTVGASSSSAQAQNAVIMGRKTWESIPPKFRPLANRLNLVVSRKGIDLNDVPSAASHSSLREAIASLRSSSKSADSADSSPTPTPAQQRQQPQGQTGKIFLIGGAQLYTEALTSIPPLVGRVLLTRITNEVECDTFLHDFASSSAAYDGSKQEMCRWRLASHAELEEYVGFEVQQGDVEEKGFKYRFELWVYGQP